MVNPNTNVNISVGRSPSAIQHGVDTSHTVNIQAVSSPSSPPTALTQRTGQSIHNSQRAFTNNARNSNNQNVQQHGNAMAQAAKVSGRAKRWGLKSSLLMGVGIALIAAAIITVGVATGGLGFVAAAAIGGAALGFSALAGVATGCGVYKHQSGKGARMMQQAKHQEVQNIINNHERVTNQEYKTQMRLGMSQGAIGHIDEVQFYSDSFSSCSCLVMYNQNTGMCGMFHVPAPHVENWRNLDDPRSGDKNPAGSGPDNAQVSLHGCRESIREMMELIQPTEIGVKAGTHGDNAGVMLSSDDLDADDLADYVRQDIQQLSNDLNLNVQVQTGTSAGTVSITGSQQHGIDVFNGNAIAHNKVDMFRNRDAMPERLQGKALMWSHAQAGDDVVNL